MNKNIKRFASVLTAFYVFVILLSFVFVLISITHEHDGKECSCEICIYVDDIADLLQKYSGGGAGNNLSNPILSFLILLCLGFAAPQFVKSFSLLSQKVKLND